MEHPTSVSISCVSLGMVIIDEIHIPGRPPLVDVLGGSASFVTLGQRLFSRKPRKPGCLVIAGDDFPDIVREHIEGWGTELVTKRRSGEKSTRGKLVYQDDTFDPKTFVYLGSPLRATPSDLIDTPLLHSKAFHLFGTPEEILQQVPLLIQLRSDQGNRESPFVVWEPLPAACKMQNQQSFFEACKLVDVFSPNHIELYALFQSSPTAMFSSDGLENYSQTMVDSSIGPKGDGVIIVRAAEHGALSLSRTSRPTWLPSYYEKGSPMVIDPTGAGNTFLGGFIAGWHDTGNVRESVCYGHVAASFALEQIGLPEVHSNNGKVTCNGFVVKDRLEEYKRRLGEAVVRSESVL